MTERFDEPAVFRSQGVTNMPKVTEDQIREHAHRLWEKAGRPDGQHLEFWQQAQTELEADEPGDEAVPNTPKPMPE